MKKYLLIILLFVNTFLYSEKTDEKTVINSLGQAVLTETYKNESDGLYKIDWYYKNKSTVKENLIQSILYFKNNEDFKETQIDSYKNGKKTMSTCYFYENNSKYWIKSVEKLDINGYVTNINYTDKEPSGLYLSIFYDNINKKTIKQELYYKENNDKVEKVFRYFDNTNDVKEEIYFLEDSKNDIKKATKYFYDFDKRTRKHQDVEYYPNKEFALSAKFDFYLNGNIKEQNTFFEENHYSYIKYIVKKDESGKINDIKYYDKSGNEVNP